MKCPKCGWVESDVEASFCAGCGMPFSPTTCQHEPANFSMPSGPLCCITWTIEGTDARIPGLPLHVCRLCGVFYTDIDAIRAGEQKYEESQ